MLQLMQLIRLVQQYAPEYLGEFKTLLDHAETEDCLDQILFEMEGHTHLKVDINTRQFNYLFEVVQDKVKLNRAFNVSEMLAS